jgi:hypothetical protein
MRGMLRTLSVFFGTIASACEVTPGFTPTAAEALNMGSFEASELAGVGPSATGSGHYYVADELRTLAFSAVGHADGTASGEYEIDVHATGVRFHVTVTCLSVRGNTAWIAGIIDRSSGPPVQEGTVSYFYAVDNGEGANAAADTVSVARINDVPGAAQEFCTTQPLLLPPRAVVHGNVAVRG